MSRMEKKAVEAEEKAATRTARADAKAQAKAQKKAAKAEKRKKSWWWNLKRWHRVSVYLLIVAMIVVGGAAGAKAYLKSKLNQMDRTAVKFEEIDERELSCVDVDGYVNILLLGVDARDINNMKDARSDCIIIASIEEETGKVFLTSIYRDTYLKIADGWYDKINHSFVYGGAESTMKALNEALDLNIKKYVLFNFKSVADVVDALGGITVNVEDYEIEQLNKYTEETAWIIGSDYQLVEAPGEQTIYGPQAVSYGRIRKGVGDDFKRTERMRTVISKLVDKVKTAGILKLNELVDLVLPQIQTNLSDDDIITLATMVKDFNILGSDGFPYNVSTGYLGEVSYVFPVDLYADVVELHKKLFGQMDYQPTEAMSAIASQILYDTTYSSGQTSIDIAAYTEDPANQGDALDPGDTYLPPEPAYDPNAEVPVEEPVEEPVEPVPEEPVDPAPTEPVDPEPDPEPVDPAPGGETGGTGADNGGSTGGETGGTAG